MQIGDSLSELQGDLIAQWGRDRMGMAPEEVLKCGCVGDEFEEDVDLSLVLKAVAHLNHTWMLQFA